MVIRHNLSAINANRQFNVVNDSLCKSAEKLSSGYKINRAGDDAAGLSISEKMRKQIRGLTQGVSNTEDGISMCQVADGALNEVNDMLQRMNELAVKAANGVNSQNDREAIQNEIDQLITEIDRIGETTKFNEIYLFKNRGYVSGTVAGTEATTTISAPAWDGVSYDCELENGPFSADASGNYLKLSVTTTDNSNNAHWPLIYGNGSTSHTSVFGAYSKADGTTATFSAYLNDITPTNYSANTSGTDKVWQRSFEVSSEDGELNLEVQQKVTLHQKGSSSQYYTVEYTVNNKGSTSVTYTFAQHEDTAYNNNDICEGYYINSGTKIEKNTLYTTTSSYAGANTVNSLPGSFSIVNCDDALCFTENITNYDADTLVVGHYNQIWKTNLYTSNSISGTLGTSTDREDLGFTMLWSNKTLAAHSSNTMHLDQGMIKLEEDTNIPSGVTPSSIVTISTGNTPVEERAYLNSNIWIQAGAECYDGMAIKMNAIDSEILSLDDMNVMSETDAGEGINKVSSAIKFISAFRSRIGAFQNRLEHTVLNEDNIVENTSSSESAIRDTDMATEMVSFSNLNVLKQAGISMLTQANQKNSNVLALLT